MAGRFVEILRRSNPVLDSLLGNLADLRVKKSYNEAIDEIEGKFRKEKTDYDKYLSYSEKLANTNLNPDEFIKTVPVIDPLTNTQDWNITADKTKLDDPNSEISKTLNEYYKTIEGKELSTEQQQQGFKEYVKANPEIYKKLHQNNHITPLNKTEPLSEQEITNKYYQKAGITDNNEQQWYENYRKSNPNVQNYNERLLNFVYGKYQDLYSPGSLGDSYFKLFGNIANQYLINPKQEELDPLANIKPKEWTKEKVNNVWYWKADVYNKKTRQWEKRIVRPLSEQEIKDETVEKKKKLDEMTPIEFSALTYEDIIKNYGKAEIYGSLADFSNDIREKLFTIYPEWKELYDPPDKTKTGGRKLGGKLPPLKGVNKDNLSDVEKYLKLSADYNKGDYGKDKDGNEKTKEDRYKELLNMRQQLLRSGIDEKDLDEYLNDYYEGKEINKKEFTEKNKKVANFRKKYKQEKFYGFIDKSGKVNEYSAEQWFATIYQAKDKATFYSWKKTMEDYTAQAIKEMDNEDGARLWSYLQQIISDAYNRNEIWKQE
jgi:hypothetical protein